MAHPPRDQRCRVTCARGIRSEERRAQANAGQPARVRRESLPRRASRAHAVGSQPSRSRPGNLLLGRRIEPFRRSRSRTSRRSRSCASTSDDGSGRSGNASVVSGLTRRPTSSRGSRPTTRSSASRADRAGCGLDPSDFIRWHSLTVAPSPLSRLTSRQITARPRLSLLAKPAMIDQRR